MIHPKVESLTHEKALANGDQLHQICRQTGTLFFEMFGRYSISFNEIIGGFKR